MMPAKTGTPARSRLPGSPNRTGGGLSQTSEQDNNDYNNNDSSNDKDNDNSFTAINMKNSPALTTTTTTCNSQSPQRTCGTSRLPSIKERRPSYPAKKAPTPSFSDANSNTPTQQRRSSLTTNTTPIPIPNAGTTTTTTGTTPLQRRASVPQGMSPHTGLVRRMSKPSFAGIGRRVSNMVRYRMALQGRQRQGMTAESEEGEREEENHMEAIHEMPQSPRFSAYMSAEAQYALMKGYEDKLYEKITLISPELRPCLKRALTPKHRKVSIPDPDAPKDSEEVAESSENKSRTSSFTSGYGSSPGTRFSSFSTTTSLSPDMGRSFSPESGTPHFSTPLPSPFLKPLRRQSIAVTSNVSRGVTSPGTDSADNSGWQLQRSHSLPTLDTGLSHGKRLVLTYRLESAMDILDTLKRRNMENSLSPRVFRIPRQVDVVKDFNCWSQVWQKEFKEVQAQ